MEKNKVPAQYNFETNGTDSDPTVQGQFLDTIQVPYWDGNPNHAFPSVTLVFKHGVQRHILSVAVANLAHFAS
jgi:hypothetical protein